MCPPQPTGVWAEDVAARGVGSHCALAVEEVQFRRGETEILTNISWQVNAGELAAVLGANGCGKSTLLRMASGYLWPTRGKIAVLGHRFGEYPLQLLRERLGIVEAVSVFPFDAAMTTRDVVCSGFFGALTIAYYRPTAAQWQRSSHLLEQVGLGPQRDQYYNTLSTGQRMRAVIARAMVRSPGLLLLDEPTNGLDLPGRESVLAVLAGLHQQPAAPAIVMVTHHLEELLPGTQNILLLNRTGGIQARGAPEAVLTEAHLTAAYNWPITPIVRDGRYYAHTPPRAWPQLLTPL